MKTLSFRRICSLLALMLIASAVLVASASAEVNVGEQVVSIEKEQVVCLTVNESTPWNSTEVATIEEQIDRVLASSMLFGINDPPTTQGLQPIRSDPLNIAGDGYSSGSAVFSLYKVTTETDPNYDYYILWMKATGLNVDDGLIHSYLREVKPGLMLRSSNNVLIDWEPIGDTSTNSNIVITMSLAVNHLGGSAGISQTFDLQQGHVGPDELSASGGGYFKPHWNGNFQGSQGLVGGAEFRVPQGASYNYDLSLKTTGARYF